MRTLPRVACTLRMIVRQVRKTRTVAVIRFARVARLVAIGRARRDAIRDASTPPAGNASASATSSGASTPTGIGRCEAMSATARAELAERPAQVR
ncbi:hypothetical protein [Burkholderia sp. NRF60-BP8]|uniref:hypothetical protein n=1 Tax=Burkholderia sp. NRF60-BP8 TaxID=1637853 RepID=UPI000857F30A|nr:hypothetical protein [Burkholderia sp. NRF60-BP8]AOI75166.1 hypothetical protein WS54_02190 [Burkholderia sp. NRF60-BP8]